MTGEGFGGLWAHSLDKDGKIDRQIRILRQARPGAWLVQNYSWIDGTPTTISVVTESCLEDGAHCILYADNEAMTFAWEHGPRGHNTWLHGGGH